MSSTLKGGDDVSLRGSSVLAMCLPALLCVSMTTGTSLADASPSASVPKSPRTLHYGSSGPDVKKLQVRLRDLRHFCGIRIDGVFGKMTQRCVIDFQRIHRLPDDGIVGKKTRMVMSRAKPVIPSQCKGRNYCILTRADWQVTFFKSPKIDGGILIIGISSGKEMRYTDRFIEKYPVTRNGKRHVVTRVRVVRGYAHTPRGWGTLGPREQGNQRSRLCARNGPCMLDPMYISGGPFGWHTFAYHGSGSVPSRPASHGCIRVPPEIIRWLQSKYPTSVTTTVGVIGSNFAYAKTKAPPNS